jgi:hypothetical protein
LKGSCHTLTRGTFGTVGAIFLCVSSLGIACIIGANYS